MVKERAKSDGKSDEHEGGKQIVRAGERGHQNGELAHEETEGRESDDGNAADDENGTGEWNCTPHAANAIDAQSREGIAHPACSEEQESLGEGVIEGVQQCAEEAERAANANAERDNSHV